MSAAEPGTMVPAGVDPETGEVTILAPADVRLAWQPMDLDAARKVTNDIKTYAIRLCHLVRDAKTGQAWSPLGYDTWGEYVETEFEMSRQRAQQLIDHANKLDVLAEVVELAAPPVEAISERATRGLKTDDLRAALVAAIEESPADLTEAERLIVANKAIDTLRKAKAAATTAVDALTPKIPAPEVPAPPVSDPSDGEAELTDEQRLDAAMARHQIPDEQAPSSAPSGGQEGDAASTPPAPQPHGERTQHGDAPEAGTDADTTASGAADGDGGEPVPPPAPPVTAPLPDDWRDRIAKATHLLGCSATAVAAAATPDDIADLTSLAGWLHDFDAALAAEQTS